MAASWVDTWSVFRSSRRTPRSASRTSSGEYQAALAAGDVERIVATFEPDGCFREPAGGEFRVCGTDALRDLFTTFFGVGGGITLEHCTATEDGTRTALEFNAIRWGSTDMPPQAGIAVYERGPTGRIADARVYDDVDPPPCSTTRMNVTPSGVARATGPRTSRKKLDALRSDRARWPSPPRSVGAW